MADAVMEESIWADRWFLYTQKGAEVYLHVTWHAHHPDDTFWEEFSLDGKLRGSGWNGGLREDWDRLLRPPTGIYQLLSGNPFETINVVFTLEE